MQAYSIARLPRIEFGSGTFKKIPDLAASYGRRVLLVTGGQSFRQTEQWEWLHTELHDRGIHWEQCNVTGEPSPQLVDETVREYSDHDLDVVLGIGGGSALDAAKAIAGLLRVKRSVMDYLEGVGPELEYEGPALPFIAVPTTAGTGSEATKNAVLSVHGRDGFKKSFRHEMLVAQFAVVDPDLLATCPPDIIAANGMDALTQLIESYVSIKANVFTDSMAVGALRAARDGLLNWYTGEGDQAAAREGMAHAALISGITLAQVGLGSVHGLASPLGAFFPIPHGVVCGTLVAEATATNIAAMQQREPENPALMRYARLGEILCQKRHASADASRQALVHLLRDWTDRLDLQRLSQYGVDEADLDHVVANSRGSSMQTNPIVLKDEEIRALLSARL
ncbi:MAG: alcohol dehydrogenase [Acidithiobacillales bacterium SG8_45]|jgi:alcohol dehydrogenase class IV|nr:MAG: alcohol dehydrogenase [Acidithiobacillales bacterium SG8_45]